MMKNTTRLIALLLAVVMLTIGLASCAETGSGEDSTHDTTASTVENNTAPPEADTTPTTDEWGRPYVASPTPENFKFEDNTVITVLLRSNNDVYTREFFSDSENGDMLNDEIYSRNLVLEEQLNFTFEFIEGGDRKEVTQSTITEFESGGASNIDIVSNYAYYATSAALRDCYQNLYSVDSLDVSNPWWNPSYVDAATIQDQLYFIVGDLNLSVVDRSLAIYYNRDIANNYQLGDLYSVVLDNKWTIDTLLEYTKDTWIDTNQSGTMDLPDTYGIVSCSNSEAYDAFLTAFGINYMAKTNDGGLEICWDTEKVSKAIDLQIQLYTGNQGGFAHNNIPDLADKFVNGETLFWLHLIYGSSAINQSMRNMSGSYGLLPLPKYDLDQEKYKTTVQDAYCVMSVMKTSRQLSAVGTVLEEWCYRSYGEILPVYCEVVMKSRYLKDSESGMIFDLILDSISFDTGMVYGAELDQIATSTRSIVKSGVNSFASVYKQKLRAYSRKISDLVTDFSERK